MVELIVAAALAVLLARPIAYPVLFAAALGGTFALIIVNPFSLRAFHTARAKVDDMPKAGRGEPPSQCRSGHST
jgi:hypothetical protein